ncbi:hypothetical protein Cpir12675_003789 [Ceratocystis pirilliformis]|uniref:Zn(2)-C6 fungal-type domain-containing protein n=1 Tax=Ceratocystis pirilliformis TaxID=259994 RepID=A0ABR3Z1S2_9PEZI
MGLHSPISTYRQSVSSDTPSELISPTLSTYSSRRSSEKSKFQGYPSPYSSSPPETMNSSAYSYSSSSSSSSSHSHPAYMSKQGEQHRSQSPRALAPPAAYQSHSVHQAGPQQQAARPQLPPISSFFSHVSFSRPESTAPSFAGPPSPEQRHQQHQSQQRPHHRPPATPSTSAPPPPYYRSHGSHGGMSINTTVPASNGRPSSSHVSPMSANVPEPYRYDNANSTSSSGRSYSSTSSSSRPDYLLSRDSPPQARHQQVQSHSHSRPPLQYSSTEPRHSISAVSVSSQTSASAVASSVQSSADGISTVSPADASSAASSSFSQEGLGPKIWTGTHFLPRFIKAAQVPGEGLCYFYDDGTHCKTVIDGEAVNAHWGVTKAGKPRKRLAIACVTCREKKIKCDPDYPRCVQCDKFGRVCRFKNAPRGGHNVAASSQTSTEDSSRRAVHFIRPSTEATSPLLAAPASAPPSIRPHISAPPRRPASPEPLSPHKRMRTSYDTYEHARTSSRLPSLPPPSQHHQPASYGHSSLSHMQHHEPWQPVRDISRDLPRLHESLSSTPWNRRDPYVAAP